MATASVRSRRRPVRAVEQVHHTVTRPSLLASVTRLALSRPARTTYLVLGTVGLAALAVAVVGPRRIEREVIKPLRGAIEPQAEKLPLPPPPPPPLGRFRGLRDPIGACSPPPPPAGAKSW